MTHRMPIWPHPADESKTHFSMIEKVTTRLSVITKGGDLGVVPDCYFEPQYMRRPDPTAARRDEDDYLRRRSARGGYRPPG